MDLREPEEWTEKLAGGQWQHLALAHAIMPRTFLIIIDEPTSSLEHRGEQRFFDHLLHRLNRRSGRPTVRLISYCFSPVRQAATILVLERTGIRTAGGHEELLRTHTGYVERFEAQERWYR